MNNNQFTPHAIAALKFAQHEALERGKSHIGPEHILLGLLHERECVAAHVLSELGVEFESARLRVGRIAPIARLTARHAAALHRIRFMFSPRLAQSPLPRHRQGKSSDLLIPDGNRPRQREQTPLVYHFRRRSASRDAILRFTRKQRQTRFTPVRRWACRCCVSSG